MSPQCARPIEALLCKLRAALPYQSGIQYNTKAKTSNVERHFLGASSGTGTGKGRIRVLCTFSWSTMLSGCHRYALFISIFFLQRI